LSIYFLLKNKTSVVFVFREVSKNWQAGNKQNFKTNESLFFSILKNWFGCDFPFYDKFMKNNILFSLMLHLRE